MVMQYQVWWTFIVFGDMHGILHVLQVLQSHFPIARTRRKAESLHGRQDGWQHERGILRFFVKLPTVANCIIGIFRK